MSATNQNLSASVSPLVSIELHDINGKQVPAVTSLQVAEAFGKEHFQVMRDIRNLLESDDFSQSNFVLVHYMDAKGEERPMYVMSRDGFVLLGMGFTGAKARAMKISYIVRFNEMEAELASRSAAPILPKDYPAALRALADAEEKRLRIEQTLAVEQPKARVYDVTFADRQLTLAKFCRRLRGVNTNSTKQDMERAGILYRQGGSYRLYAKYRDTHFAERTDDRGYLSLIVLDKGKQLLTKLYLDGKLTMKKGYDRPLKVIGA
jgi:Rha family phage regulatory protein